MYLKKRCTECTKYIHRMDFNKDPDHFDGLEKVCKFCIEKKEEEEEDSKEWIGIKSEISREDSILGIKNIDEFTRKVSTTIQQIDKKTGEVIAEYDTPILAGEGIERDPTSIRNVIKGRSKSAYGFFWKYKTI